jgi:hypothetical protein
MDTELRRPPAGRRSGGRSCVLPLLRAHPYSLSFLLRARVGIMNVLIALPFSLSSFGGEGRGEEAGSLRSPGCTATMDPDNGLHPCRLEVCGTAARNSALLYTTNQLGPPLPGPLLLRRRGRFPRPTQWGEGQGEGCVSHLLMTLRIANRAGRAQKAFH